MKQLILLDKERLFASFAHEHWTLAYEYKSFATQGQLKIQIRVTQKEKKSQKEEKPVGLAKQNRPPP